MQSEARREIVLSGENFKVIRQLTFQLPNLSREILSRWGWNSDIKSLLKGLARSIPFEISPTARVNIVITNDSISNALAAENNRSAGAADAPDTEIVRFLPSAVAHIWVPLLDEASEFLGSVEAQHRTGFYENEIRAALNALRSEMHG
ncbi:MAG: hypothetical protein J2P18_08530 [Nocardia sp.]|nr:hypothetical protein [Nocardia sp.]